MGFSGLVVLVDEAERCEWAQNSYRIDRARDLILGLALASANKSTRGLKHYRDNESNAYRPRAPSRLHAVFLFTWPRGLCGEIARKTRVETLNLKSLGKGMLSELARNVAAVYGKAYGRDVGVPQIEAGSGGLDPDADVRPHIRVMLGDLDTTHSGWGDR